MSERRSTTPDTLSPRSSSPADLGGRAVIATAELQETPESPEVDVEQREAERKKNVTENLRVLYKRFGERFIKGDLMEGGGYIGGGARELLANFMDRPSQRLAGFGENPVRFADVLKRVIPNREGAWRLLKDNHAYIQAALEKMYEADPDYEPAPVKDPYELARSVGYELTGPFASTSEFVPYDKQDFPPGQLGRERLCTFNDPVGRLKNYHILWLRHAEVADTLPADQLTADNLSGAWKTYLKTIGRYDQATDSYNLEGLSPAREDPYGISSMSVQVSRTGAHVSIKNRYNHLVASPDNTLDSNLDNVAYGLRRAIYHRIGREDLMNKAGVALAEGYIDDNEGGIHSYKYEEDNVYYSDYEYISDGIVTTIDRGRYYMISPQLYVPKNGRGDELRLGKRAKDSTGLEVSEDVRFLYRNVAGGNEKDPRAVELRQAYAERDRAELTQRLHEALIGQARSAYDAYRDVAAKLVERRRFFAKAPEIMTEAGFVGLLEHKEAEWRENGVIDQLVRDLIEKGSQPNLIATPNVLAGWKQLRELAVGFGSDQPYETYIYEKLYENYSAEELSGQPTEGLLRLSIIPSAYNMEAATAEEQRAQLARLQHEQPEIGFKVPSVLDSILYWHKLRRERGGTLQGNGVFNTTYTRHFNLRPVRLDGWSDVPYSSVYDNGGPYLDRRDAVFRRDGRVSVG